jgi:putative heme-binding domain-containing protein
MLEQIVAMIVSRDPKNSIPDLMKILRDAEAHHMTGKQAAILEGIAKGLQGTKRGSHSGVDQSLLLRMFFESEGSAVRKGILHLFKVVGLKSNGQTSALARAMETALDHNSPEDMRADAIDFISVGDPAMYSTQLKSLFVPQEPLTIQLAALRSLGAIPDIAISHYLLDRWQSLTPQVQDAVVSTFLTTNERITLLLDAIDANRVLSTSITWPRKVRLMAQRNEALRDRSRAIFTGERDNKVTQSFMTALQLKGDAKTGENIFQKNCGLCHQVRGKLGVAIGPDLGTIHNWSAKAIMENTLDPNLSISSGFDLWSVELNNGESLQGIIATETPGALTLRNYAAADRTIKRSDIKSIKSLNMSIMPLNLEEQITQQDMADLLAFLKLNK